MASPRQKNQPKYMCLKGKTQYEMAQAIDAAAAQAEQAYGQNVEQMALQLWYEQFEQQVQDELNIYQDNLPVVEVMSEEGFVSACEQLWQFTLNYPSNQMADNLLTGQAQQLFRQSFMDVIDMLKARDLWRFDLQRYLQRIQGRVMHECQRYTKP